MALTRRDWWFLVKLFIKAIVVALLFMVATDGGA